MKHPTQSSSTPCLRVLSCAPFGGQQRQVRASLPGCQAVRLPSLWCGLSFVGRACWPAKAGRRAKAACKSSQPLPQRQPASPLGGGGMWFRHTRACAPCPCTRELQICKEADGNQPHMVVLAHMCIRALSVPARAADLQGGRRLPATCSGPRGRYPAAGVGCAGPGQLACSRGRAAGVHPAGQRRKVGAGTAGGGRGGTRF